MPNLYLTTLTGTLSTATLKEIFVHTLAVNATANQDAMSVATTVMNAWKGAWTTNATFKNIFPTSVVWTEATAAQVMDAASDQLQAAAHVPFSPTLAGIGTTAHPSQNAIAVSFSGGAKANGTPYRGRSYLPCPATSIPGTDGTLIGTTTQQIRDTYVTFFTNLKGGNCVPCIWSRKSGAFQTISLIRVGNKIDTVRTRRNELPETYSQVAFATAAGVRAGGDPNVDLSGLSWQPL